VGVSAARIPGHDKFATWAKQRGEFALDRPCNIVVEVDGYGNPTGVFEVEGNHDYAEEGIDTVSVTR
jgi:hypothetical protein